MNAFDEPDDATRRVFVKGVGMVSLGLVFASVLGGCEAIIERIKNRPVRRRLRTGSVEVDNNINTYRNAVAAMKALPASDPRSWTAQAAIHGSVAGGFNLCQHGTDHFFSWHRAYLVYFERICQELTGDKSFGLPYWNWNQNPALHAAFTAPGSALLHPRSNTTVAGNPAFSNATLTTILSDTNFFTFSSQVEGTPHNTAHGAIGGDMGTGGSAIDPVFWTHHCMADYLWAKWNIELENSNPNNSGWIGTSWNHFVDAQGNPANVSAGITTLLPFLSYRYESSVVGSFDAGPDLGTLAAQDLKKIETRLRNGADIRYDIRKRIPVARGATLSIARPFSVQAQVAPADFAALLESDSRQERILMGINHAHVPEASDFFVRVFINLPSAGPQTPLDSIHFAGSFAFFGTHAGGHGRHPGKTDFLVNVTDTLKALQRGGVLRADQPLSVQLVAVPATERFIRPETQLMLRELDLIVSPVTVRSK